MRICLMIEGQEDVTWGQWLELADRCEGAGLEGLFRSDHYQSVMGQLDRGSLDAWATLAGVAARSSTIRLGTLVSPATFRHPSVLAKNVVTVDHISGGRAELGLGGGWYEGEHRAYGFRLPPPGERMEMLAEQLEIVRRQWTEESFSFDGRHYRVESVVAMPKPVQQPAPTVIVGGHAGPRSVALAARWADEYNTLVAGVDELKVRRERVAAAWREAGRDPDSVRFSAMLSAIVGRDRAEVRERVARLLARTGRGGSPDEILANPPAHWLAGTVDEVGEQLAAMEAVGVTRVMAQHLVHDDLDMIDLLGTLR